MSPIKSGGKLVWGAVHQPFVVFHFIADHIMQYFISGGNILDASVRTMALTPPSYSSFHSAYSQMVFAFLVIAGFRVSALSGFIPNPALQTQWNMTADADDDAVRRMLIAKGLKGKGDDIGNSTTTEYAQDDVLNGTTGSCATHTLSCIPHI
jgi:hypothetical protein